MPKDDYGTTELRRIHEEGLELGWDINHSPLRNAITNILADVTDMTYDELLRALYHTGIAFTNEQVTEIKNSMRKAGQLESCDVERPRTKKGFRLVKKDDRN